MLWRSELIWKSGSEEVKFIGFGDWIYMEIKKEACFWDDPRFLS